MDDFIIKTGDTIKITMVPPTVIPAVEAPVPLTGSSTNVVIGESPVCLRGDELPAELREPVAYTAPPFTNPGTGTLSILLLPPNTTELTENGKPILLRGQKFGALLTVSVPATQTTPAGPVPDPAPERPGTAEFITTNSTVRAG